jgi:chromate transporter
MSSGTKIRKARHWTFLKSVFWLGCTAFGGPQLHLPQFKKRLVDKHRFIDEEDLIEINAFCSVLPGPSTTQTITAIGYKVGGGKLAFLALLAWALPGALLMSIIALSPRFLGFSQLRFLQPMVAAFLIYAIFTMAKWIKPSGMNYSITLTAGVLGFFLQTPWFFPVGVITAGYLSSRFNQREFLPKPADDKPIVWRNLIIFLAIFALVGAGGILLALYESPYALPVRLFENTYRISVFSFGGGNVLAAMGVEQYVLHKPRMSMEEFNTGLGLLQALPGPNFNLAVYLNAIAMKNGGFGFLGQLLGCFLGLVAVFLPGTMAVLFAYPLWGRLKNIEGFRKSIDGIFAVSVGFILTATLILNLYFFQNLQALALDSRGDQIAMHASIYALSLGLLWSRKLPLPIIVIIVLILGYFLPV